MWEHTLEEDIPDEFKHSTLKINDEKQIGNKQNVEDNSRTTGESNGSNWKDNLLSPFMQSTFLLIML